jgi:hypothetical protein
MTRASRLAAGLAAALATLSLVTAPAVRAITYGSVDDQRAFPNVGAFIVQRTTDGAIFPICSGTLSAPTVFLTAAHCTAFYTQDLAPGGFTALVSFDSPIGFGGLTDLQGTNLIPVLQVATNPAFNQAQSDSGDIGVLILPERATRRIPVAALPRRGMLIDLSGHRRRAAVLRGREPDPSDVRVLRLRRAQPRIPAAVAEPRDRGRRDLLR